MVLRWFLQENHWFSGLTLGFFVFSKNQPALWGVFEGKSLVFSINLRGFLFFAKKGVLVAFLKQNHWFAVDVTRVLSG